MKSERKIDVIKMLENEGFRLKTNNGHIKYEHPITGIIALITHKPILSPGAMRKITKSIKDSKDKLKALKIVL